VPQNIATNADNRYKTLLQPG